MNVTFHTLTALATAAVLSSRQEAQTSRSSAARDRLPVLAVGFVAGVIVHGLLDIAPHSYPIRSGADVVLSLSLCAAAIALGKPQHRLLVGACFLGAIFPDLVDLGPAILNKRLGWSVPVVKVFPWHRPQYSGSIYDGSRVYASLF